MKERIANRKMWQVYSGFLDKSGILGWGRSHITTDCGFINEHTKVLIRSVFCCSYMQETTVRSFDRVCERIT